MDGNTESGSDDPTVSDNQSYLDLLEKKDAENLISNGFKSMAFELQEIFTNYINKVNKQISRELETLEYEKLSFKQEKQRLLRELDCMKKFEFERIQKLQKRLEDESDTAKRSIMREKQENAKKLLDEKELFNRKQQELANYWQMVESRLKEERQELERIKNKITEMNSFSKPTVEINVGGTLFEISKSVLTEGKAKGSILERIFTGKTLEIEIETDKNGRIFFDRDPEIFKIVLNYLRDHGKSLPTSSHPQMSLNILKEMKYYEIKFYENSLVYVFGGSDGEKILDSSEVLMLPTINFEDGDLEMSNQNFGWSKVKSSLIPRAHASSTDLVNSSCALFGGYNNSSKALDTLEIYDPLTDFWREGPSMITGRRNLSSATLEDGRIMAIGGFDGERIIGATEFYDPRTNYWSAAPRLNTPRSSASCVKLDPFCIAIIGGTCGEERLKSIEVFDVRRNQWELLQSKELLEIRSGSVSYSLHGRVCIWGGIDQDNNILSSGELLNTSMLTKDNVLTYRRPLKKGLSEAKTCPISLGKYSALICGGQTINEAVRDTLFYSFDDDNWEYGPSMSSVRYGHSITKLDI
ncbi:kelch protein K13 [Cryptosporidium felis]|nr:kelch protein K13 [Cryptosporidium felis]